jgi:hypothetical protein
MVLEPQILHNYRQEKAWNGNMFLRLEELRHGSRVGASPGNGYESGSESSIKTRELGRFACSSYACPYLGSADVSSTEQVSGTIVEGVCVVCQSSGIKTFRSCVGGV